MQQWIRIAILTCAVFVMAGAARGDVKLGSVFGSNMVLQRDKPILLWGTASPGEQVNARFGKDSASSLAGTDGAWRIMLKSHRAQNQAETLIVSGTNTITLTNILVGDVWICSGQSNMDFALLGAHNGAAEAAQANYPTIRLLTVGKNPSPIPLDDMSGSWTVCTPDTSPYFSAVGYFFGRELNRQLNVPIGLINSSWGGTPAETWTSGPALEALPQYAAIMQATGANAQTYVANKTKYDARHATEENDYNARRDAWIANELTTDPGVTGNWADASHSTADWKTVTVPVVMGSNPLGAYMGSVWHRKTVQIPPSWVGKDLIVHVGAVDDTDDTYVNGVHVGHLGYDLPNFWTLPRAYPVAASTVTSSSVTVAVRAFNLVGDVGMFGPATAIYLALASDDTQRVSLAGDWVYQFGDVVKQADVPQQNYTPVPGSQAGDPAALYNGMINPLIPLGIKGVIWYQGESNAGDPVGYRTLFPAMIQSWRDAWGQATYNAKDASIDFPFAFVQLANYMAVQTTPIEANSWADIRESQAATLSLPKTSMATIIDIGNGDNIHPTDKQDVGIRLALPILAKVYGKHVLYSGPTYKSMSINDGKATLSFDFADGLQAKGDKLTGFAIAGSDKVFHFAQAKIDGHGHVVVWSDKVPQPVAVRYAWANNPVCDLYNQAALPAVPFRTDGWKPSEIGVAND